MKAENITKKFDGKTVFDSFSADFPDGRFTSLTGASGSGKTTLLRILSRLDKDHGGTVTGGGKISFAFQEPLLFEGATVFENVALKKDAREHAKRVLLALGINGEDFALFPSQLSGGMAKRVSLARAIVFPADTYFIDEPFAGLDDTSKSMAAEVILCELRGKTVVISTHDRSFASSLDFHVEI